MIGCMAGDREPKRNGGLAPEGIATLLDQMFRLCIEPAIEERSRRYQGPRRPPPSAPPQVLLNDAVQFVARVRVTRASQSGEPTTLASFDSIEDLAPVEVDPNAGWIALA